VSTYHVENFGCRATQADGAALERQFERLGMNRSSDPAQSDLVILNTCTVTAAADQDARAAIRRVRRHNPTAKIVITGCYAQRAPEEVAALPGVACVVGNSHKHQLAEIVLSKVLKPVNANSAFFPVAGLFPHTASEDNLELQTENWSREAGSMGQEGRMFVSNIFAHTELLAAPVFDLTGAHESDRTRPNLKVQDGCDNRCSFCVIPYVRGQSRSLPLVEVLREVKALVDAGYRELVISGINLGRWGRDLDGGHRTSDLGPQTSDLSKTVVAEVRRLRSEVGGLRFEDLIRAVLAETALEKLRISSVEPMDWSSELIGLMAESPRIAKHAHVPMQSGSDAVLRRMHRKYRPWHYREKIEQIRAAIPTAAIGADVMAGFPGETDAEFEATRRLIADLPFTYLHVFTYSARPGTPAATQPGQVPVNVARERNRILRELGEEKKLAFLRGFVGKTAEAITLRTRAADSSVGRVNSTSAERTAARESDTDFTEALTDNYLKLHLKGRHEPNRWLRARVEDVADGALMGVVDPGFV
jgi:threonylcarbamoyladenosine tRNA methylthiotransferase MtaB